MDELAPPEANSFYPDLNHLCHIPSFQEPTGVGLCLSASRRTEKQSHAVSHVAN